MTVQYVDLLILGLAVASTGVLGFIVYFNNPQSATNRAFLGFSLLGGVWGVLNYTSTQVESFELSLWMWRLVIFTAVWFCFGIFHLARIFPQERPVFGVRYIWFIIPSVTAVSFLTLTPLVFATFRSTPLQGSIPPIVNGPLIGVFGLTIVGLVGGAIYMFLKRMVQARGILRMQYGLIVGGTITTFALLIICNFILPVAFNIYAFIPLGSVFILPFIVCTGYAIARYGLFNARIVVTELFSFVMVLATLLQILFSTTFFELALRSGIFVLVLIFDILLIKRTASEIKSHELIQKQEKELEKTNLRLQEMDTQKNEFLSFASHQLRTPLTAIKWSAGGILDGTFGDLPQELKDPIQTISDESSMMALFINDYLNVSRIEQGRMEYRFVPTNIVELVRITALQLEPGLRQKGLTLTLAIGVETVMVWADASKLTQVISNLIDNAMKYTPQGGITVMLRKVPLEKKVRIEIQDTGIGMDPETGNKLFEKFVRGDNAKVINGAGSGLGLFIVKTFVEAHKGTIHLESKGLGKGSSFIVEFPLLVQTESDALIKSPVLITE